jgi:predicted murein hydrolase (TIGR00659 family)
MSALGETSLSLVLTLVAYDASRRLYLWGGRAPVLHPMALSIALVGGVLVASEVPYARYFSGAAALHFLLGPATVALAVPLVRQSARVRALALPTLVSLIVGGLCGITTALGLARAFGADRALLASVAPKSATTPIAMGVAEVTGGVPAVAAMVVILTGVVGALCARPLLSRLGVREAEPRGFALGLACHGLGTAVAFEEGSETGAWAGLAMGLNGMLTALLVPLVLALWG